MNHRYLRTLASGALVAGSLSLIGGTAAIVSSTVAAKPAAAATTYAWTQLSPATSPPVLGGPAMAYDGSTGQLLLTGAQATDPSDETWSFDGARWQQLTPATSPPPLAHASMAYDAATGDLVLFGGTNLSTSTASGATWRWDGTTWSPYTTVNPTPPPRAYAAMAYDPATNEIVLYGGTSDGGATTALNDTWSWTGATAGWTLLNSAAASGLSGLWGAAMDYNAFKQTLELRGGLQPGGQTVYDNQLFFTAATGALDFPSAPFCPTCANSYFNGGAELGSAMAYDAATGQLIEYGGYFSAGPSLKNETWDYVADSQLSPLDPPPGRSYPAMAYDSALGRIVMFGGDTGAGQTAETWTFGQPPPVANPIRLFYAVPDTTGTSVTIAGLIDDPNNPGAQFSLAVNGSSACNNPGGPVGSATVTTDEGGIAYFSQAIPTPSGAPAVLQLVSANPAEQSNCYPVGPDNTSWANALTIPIVGGGGASSGFVATSGESRWYKVQAAPDSKVTITLSGLSDDYAVAVYSDISQADSDTSGGTKSLNKLSAESAADTFSPSAFIPSAFIPSAFIPSAFIPSAFIPSAFIPSAFIPSAFIPSAFIPSAYSPSAFIPSASTPSAFIPSAFIPSAFIPSAFIPSAFIPSPSNPAPPTPSAFQTSTYASAINRSLLTYNDEGGTADKSVTVNTWSSTGALYIRVAGRNGAADDVNRFQLAVNAGGGSCSAGVQPFGAAPAAAPAQGVNTVILTDSGRVTQSTAERTDLANQLNALAARPEVKGVVVDLAANSRVQSLDAQADANPSCPYAKDLVANAVRDIIGSYRTNNALKYVVIAGPDNVVPFFRHPDQTLIGNESGYVPPVADTSPSQAALRLSYTLSDNDYASNTVLQTQTTTFPVPDLALGRLVETEPEISGQVQAYLANAGGLLPTPSSSLVTSYDFLTLPATTIQASLQAGTGATPDTLIEPRNESPSQGWTAAQLKAAVLTGGRHDIVFIGGHFSANDTLAADYATDMITTDMEESGVNLKNAVVFSAGCHSGYNIVNGDAVPNVTLTLDWPEEFARKQAILIGGTGYQYGDTDFTAYSEQIDVNFARQLLLGSGPVAIGQALLQAKDTYLTVTPQMGAIDQKAVLEAELYGLPMASINMPHGRIPVPSDTSIVATTTAAQTDPGRTLGLTSADITVTPTLAATSVALNDVSNANAPVTASYLSGDNGTVTNPYQPVLPLVSKNVSVPNQSVRGALFLGGSYTDTHGVTPLTGAPTTEIRGVHTGFSSPVPYPEKPWSVNYFDALDGNGTGATRLEVTPAQHMSDPIGTTDTRRQYSAMSFRLYYDNTTSTYGSGATATTPALSAPPDVVEVQAAPDPDGQHIDVCASVEGATFTGVQDVVATYTDPTLASPSWQSVHLVQQGCPSASYPDGSQALADSTSWGGQVPLNGSTPGNVELLVQAVSGTGQVTMDDNLGRYYSINPAGGPQSTPCCSAAFRNVTVTSPATAPAGTAATVTATLVAYSPGANPGFQYGGPLAGQPVTFSIGSSQVTTTTGPDGVATATVPLDLAPGTYAADVGLGAASGYRASGADASTPVTVTRQATLLTLSPAVLGPDTTVTATLCATTSTTACGAGDPPVTERTVVFVLAGPLNRTYSVQTTVDGQATFNGYGLPIGRYTLTGYFSGAIPGVGTLSDPAYLPSSASVAFTTTTAYTAPPSLTVPGNITVTSTNGQGVVVPFVASASDPVDPHPVVTCSPGNPSLFAVGTTVVTCTAKDSAGNSATKSFTVNVQPPYTALGPGTTACNGTYGGSGGSVTVAANATCTLVAGTTLSGGITVQKGGTLNAAGVTVGGAVALTGAKSSTLCASTVKGTTTVTGTAAGQVIVLGDTLLGCAGDILTGSVALVANAGTVDVSSGTVGTPAVSGDLVAGLDTGPLVVANEQVGHDLVVTLSTGPVTLTGDSVGHDLVAGPNAGPVTVKNDTVGHDLIVSGNKPGGVTVTANVAGHNATCSSNNPQAGGANKAGGTRTCPT